MSLALITEANPRAMRESHPSLLTEGKWKVLAATGVKSKLSVRRSTDTTSSNHDLGDIIEGPCTVVVLVIEAHVEDAKISVHAERVKNV